MASDHERRQAGAATRDPSRPRPRERQQATLRRAALDAAAAGRLRPTVGQTFPLDDAAAAHAAIEARTAVGRTMLAYVP